MTHRACSHLPNLHSKNAESEKKKNSRINGAASIQLLATGIRGRVMILYVVVSKVSIDDIFQIVSLLRMQTSSASKPK